MIQRLQSVFLLLVAILMICVLFFPVWEKTDTQSGESIVLDAYKIFSQKAPDTELESTIYLACLAVLSAITALFEIFRYKNRLFQMKLGLLNSMLMSGLLGLYFYNIHLAKGLSFQTFSEHYKAAFFFPIAALIFNMIANRYIRKDEELVRSVDRLR